MAEQSRSMKRLKPISYFRIETIETKAKDLRDPNAQTKFRAKAAKQSIDPDKLKYLDASHCFPLEIAAFLNNHMHKPIRPSVLKKICNDEANFEMVTKNENQVDHRETDKLLQSTFTDDILPKFQEDDTYKELFPTKPTQLALEMKKNKMLRVVLPDIHFKRAEDQALKVQTLKLPRAYQAIARLFYCSFQCAKGRTVWNDNRNSSDLKIYLHAQCPEMKAGHKFTPKYHQGPKGGVYYKTSSGNKKYLKEEEIKAMILSNSKGKYHQGANGGIYYETASGKKLYLNIVELKYKFFKVKSCDVDTSDVKSDDDASSRAELTVYDSKGRKLYKGPKGGIYYKTSSGNKKYLTKDQKSRARDLFNKLSFQKKSKLNVLYMK